MTALSRSVANRFGFNGQGAATAALHYRRARADDLRAMASLFLATLADLNARNNVVAPLPPLASVVASYQHVLETGIFRIVEMEGQIAAIAGAILRDDLWFLSAFWVRPGLQRQGIGMPLLRRVWQDGVEAGATVFFTWSSRDLTAMAAYMKLGMLPGSQILQVEGSAKQLPPAPQGYEVVPLEPAVAMALDLIMLGAMRPEDHAMWHQQRGMVGRQLLYRNQPAGYFYVRDGTIGPAAWADRRHGETLMAAAMAEAGAAAPTVRLSIPGMNHTALRLAFDAGLHLTGFAHLLTTTPFPRMSLYLPSGPAFF
ncbi:MAG: GNAT family N-acetyltransferase [Anaerolineae bacterium]|nr:GNAT family N-acetyltransferase [Anaerolineae bacterium]